MKPFLMLWAFFIGLPSLPAQIKVPLPTKATDVLSQNSYSRITKNNIQATTATAGNTLPVGAFTSIINQQNYELNAISPMILVQKYSLLHFISGASFNATTGYGSYGYIQEKYPIINPLRPTDVFRNKLIRLRFQKKLLYESNRVNDYLNPLNPIPEGERILLVLSALDNVINLVLENEEY